MKSVIWKWFQYLVLLWRVQCIEWNCEIGALQIEPFFFKRKYSLQFINDKYIYCTGIFLDFTYFIFFILHFSCFKNTFWENRTNISNYNLNINCMKLATILGIISTMKWENLTTIQYVYIVKCEYSQRHGVIGCDCSNISHPFRLFQWTCEWDSVIQIQILWRHIVRSLISGCIDFWKGGLCAKIKCLDIHFHILTEIFILIHTKYEVHVLTLQDFQQSFKEYLFQYNFL